MGLAQFNPAFDYPGPPADGTPVTFSVEGIPDLFGADLDGRLLIVLGRQGSGEPRLRIGATGMDADPLLGWDLRNFHGQRVSAPSRPALFPLRALSEIPDGTYYVQAVLMTNRDLRMVNAPGNFYSTPAELSIRAGKPRQSTLVINRKLPEDALPPDSTSVKYVKLPSPLLSQFHGRPMYLRAAVTLPLDRGNSPGRKYPLVIQIGGYGTRFSAAGPLEKRSQAFQNAWSDPTVPRFIHVLLDGAGPWGDPYQVNSANNGPYGDALVTELIPWIESTWGGMGVAQGRFVTGGSTGGWVSLALQIFYPDFFGGCWSGYPDSPDFRAFETIDLYRDSNAYVNPFGFERPSKRTRFGETEFTVRHECQLENVLGDGDSYVGSGQQWGAWNAVYSPRGTDGRPMAVWEPRTGQLRLAAVRDSWERYDLRRVLEQNWATLGPRLRDKIHIWVGDADDYFLDGGAHRLDEFLSKANPPAGARIEFGSGQRHGWEPRTWTQLLEDMAGNQNPSQRPP